MSHLDVYHTTFTHSHTHAIHLQQTISSYIPIEVQVFVICIRLS